MKHQHGPVEDGPAHLRARQSGRGLRYMPPVPSTYGGYVEAHTSSAASGPHIWLTATAPANLNDPQGPAIEAALHLTASNALILAEQLTALIRDQTAVDADGHPAKSAGSMIVEGTDHDGNSAR